ncbi:MAG: nitronate monooxygenase [Pseudomonas sp.]
MSVLSLLNIQHPIIQAPMVGVSTPALAAAVSNAGALGSIGLGASTAEQAQTMIRATRALTSAPFNVNLFCHQPALADAAREAAWLKQLAPLFTELGAQPPAHLNESYRSFLASEDTLNMLLSERPAVASFHFGLPPKAWISALKAAGIVTLACVTSVAEAQQAADAGVDALVAQGAEAGGHRGVFEPAEDRLLGTFALLPLVVRATALPVIAAGGIMNGAGIAAALQLGAGAVQMGTAFILTPESAANSHYRAALQSERAQHTRVSAAISGRAARGMVNRLFDELDALGTLNRPDYPIAYDAAKALVAAASAQGNPDFAVQWAGQGAPLARELPTAVLIDTLVQELKVAQRNPLS